jgi:hypothetical protein
MSTYYLEYPLKKGYVHNWLVAGPHATAVPDLERFRGDDYKLQIAQHYYKRISDINEPPLDRGTFGIGDAELRWEYYGCLDDHLVDLSTFHHTCHYLRSWAYTQVVCPAAQQVTVVLTTNGPADVWLNRQHVHRQEHFHHQDPLSVSFQATLQEGRNEILVRFEEVAARECPYAMALCIPDLTMAEATVNIPTATKYVERRQKLERTFAYAHLERDIEVGGGGIRMHWSDELPESCYYTFRVQDWRNRIYAEALPTADAGLEVNIGQQMTLQPGDYRVVLMPRPQEYYEGDIRIVRELPVRIVHHTYSEAPYGTFESRRREALEYATRQEGDLYAEIAKIRVGRWAAVDRDIVQGVIDGINERGDCSDFYLVGLLGLLHRYPKSPALSDDLAQALEECVLNFKYWHDEPGTDPMCYTTENHSILFHACEILAGQLYPDRTFSNVGQTGQWHREKGETLALDWLYARGTVGFSEWDSNCYFEEDLLALSHLSDLAENDEVRELAAIVMDKILFTVALNSFKGVFGSTHGRTYAPMIKGGHLEATSGITRLMWGMGTWNDHIRGVVALACSDYELPSLVAAIATNPLEEMWNREQHPGVNKVTYRTPDFMLCSAQDHNPGEKGYQQHIWQATLGPGAVLFVTHPPNMGEQGAHRPNFWHGNYVLPRVAQWKDALIAIHRLPEDDWMGFTHAYFPAYEFTEWTLEDGWLFARVGGAPPPTEEEADGEQAEDNSAESEGAEPASDALPGVEDEGIGYLALTAAQGLELVEAGPSAYRELRSHGQHNVWLCLMGRRAVDGSFDEWKAKVAALPVAYEDLGVRFTTHRDDHLSFGWEGPLLLNGEEQPLSGFPHYDSPYCVADLPATQMDIQYGEYIMRLHFERPGEDVEATE